jgi:NAD(P)-dependent dehydrogenase (short-subunit alcohol dehydrogenase family)
MDLGLQGRTAYVTGGARGIGRAVADALAAEGMRVAVADVDGEALDDARGGWGEDAIVLRADLAGDGATTAARELLAALGGPPDVLVNNVGAAGQAPFEELDDATWQAGFELNLLSHVRTSRVLVPEMARAGRGAVVFVSSDLAKQPEAVPLDYGAFKAALLALAKGLALEYAPAVRVNAVCPGPIWTDLWTRPGGVADQLAQRSGLPPEEAVAQHVAERHLPFGIGQPADVAQLIAFLVSDRARHVAAAAISIDGGGVRGLA